MGEKKKMIDINKELQHLKREVYDMKQLNKENGQNWKLKTSDPSRIFPFW